MAFARKIFLKKSCIFCDFLVKTFEILWVLKTSHKYIYVVVFGHLEDVTLNEIEEYREVQYIGPILDKSWDGLKLNVLDVFKTYSINLLRGPSW